MKQTNKSGLDNKCIAALRARYSGASRTFDDMVEDAGMHDEHAASILRNDMHYVDFAKPFRMRFGERPEAQLGGMIHLMQTRAAQITAHRRSVEQASERRAKPEEHQLLGQSALA